MRLEAVVEDGAAAALRLVRTEGDRGRSLAEKLHLRLSELSYGTVFHKLRLNGRFPPKLVGVPHDPIRGDAEAGRRLLAGDMRHAGVSVAVASLWRGAVRQPLDWAEWAHGFGWLRDLAAASDRARAARLVEPLVRAWVAAFADFDPVAWRPDVLGRRTLFWTAYAPFLLASDDLVYRSAALNTLARGCRHLERSAGGAEDGLPRLWAFAGMTAGGLLMPGSEGRWRCGEQGLVTALEAFLWPDGGVASRSPLDQLELLELLLLLQSAYRARGVEGPDALALGIGRLVPALLGARLGDGALGAWHGGTIGSADRVSQAIAAAGIDAEPLRNGGHSGFQRLAAGGRVLILDAGPPPESRISTAAHAGTLAFELSDGPDRLIVNCGGARAGEQALPPELHRALKTTAAHSTLVLSDINSTRIREDGRLGRGVTAVLVRREEQGEDMLVEASHDGYRRRFGLDHHRRIYMAAGGTELRGEDRLTSERGAAAGGIAFSVRFHLGPTAIVEQVAEDAVLVALSEEHGWLFKARGGHLSVEDSLWLDGGGRPHPTRQLVVGGETTSDGARVNWLLQRH